MQEECKQERKHKTFRVNYQTEHGKGCIMIYVGKNSASVLKLRQ